MLLKNEGVVMKFFTADEHYGHANIVRYSNRPFSTAEEMDDVLIANHNSVVKANDVVYHIGDFTLEKNTEKVYRKYINRLNGNHVFIAGSHDYWIPDKEKRYMLEIKEKGFHLVLCHYAMRVWPRSHYNSIQLHGHSHGHLLPIGRQWDVGVDNNNYHPVPFDQIIEIMSVREDNFNLVVGKK
jgi:calcineurin-like phosphoesterase family protein